ncbi:hypothetical protein H8356DRAFT_1352975 [Neocallimastix lanati (nom. inval.)]|nr:hypothetical protein H8356DRAFT_1352975 [Neocallimastix sp. JGI-2020a]
MINISQKNSKTSKNPIRAEEHLISSNICCNKYQEETPMTNYNNYTNRYIFINESSSMITSDINNIIKRNSLSNNSFNNFSLMGNLG